MQLLREADIVGGASGNARTSLRWTSQHRKRKRSVYEERARSVKKYIHHVKAVRTSLLADCQTSFRNEVRTRTNVVCMFMMSAVRYVKIEYYRVNVINVCRPILSRCYAKARELAIRTARSHAIKYSMYLTYFKSISFYTGICKMPISEVNIFETNSK